MKKIDRSIHKMPAEQVAARAAWQASGAAGSHGDRRLRRQKTRATQRDRAFSEFR